MIFNQFWHLDKLDGFVNPGLLINFFWVGFWYYSYFLFVGQIVRIVFSVQKNKKTLNVKEL